MLTFSFTQQNINQCESLFTRDNHDELQQRSTVNITRIVRRACRSQRLAAEVGFVVLKSVVMNFIRRQYVRQLSLLSYDTCNINLRLRSEADPYSAAYCAHCVLRQMFAQAQSAQHSVRVYVPKFTASTEKLQPRHIYYRFSVLAVNFGTRPQSIRRSNLNQNNLIKLLIIVNIFYNIAKIYFITVYFIIYIQFILLYIYIYI